jgi:hypothetical protein
VIDLPPPIKPNPPTREEKKIRKLCLNAQWADEPTRMTCFRPGSLLTFGVINAREIEASK